MVYGSVWDIFVVQKGNITHFHLRRSECAVNQFLQLSDPFYLNFFFFFLFWSFFVLLGTFWTPVWTLKPCKLFLSSDWVIFIVPEGHFTHLHLRWFECTVYHFLWLIDPFFSPNILVFEVILDTYVDQKSLYCFWVFVCVISRCQKVILLFFT